MLKRIALRYLISAKPGSKGQHSIKHGSFILWYLLKYKESVPDLLETLEKVEQVYNKARYKLPRNIPVLMAERGWGTGRSIYSHKGFIQIVPFAFSDKVHFTTLIHEVAHYIHNHMIPGGFSNPTILSKYEELKSSRIPNTGGSPSDRIKDVEKGIEKHIKKLKGKSVTLGGRKAEVLNFKGTKVVLKYLTQTPEEERDGILGATLSFVSFASAIKDPTLQALARRRLELFDILEGFEGEVGVNAYEDHRSKWFPTDYSKTNPNEWFAELVTARLVAPSKMDREVRGWLDSIVRK